MLTQCAHDTNSKFQFRLIWNCSHQCEICCIVIICCMLSFNLNSSIKRMVIFFFFVVFFLLSNCCFCSIVKNLFVCKNFNWECSAWRAESLRAVESFGCIFYCIWFLFSEYSTGKKIPRGNSHDRVRRIFHEETVILAHAAHICTPMS